MCSIHNKVSAVRHKQHPFPPLLQVARVSSSVTRVHNTPLTWGVGTATKERRRKKNSLPRRCAMTRLIKKHQRRIKKRPSTLV